MPWIQTCTGRSFDPLNPDPSAVCIDDIAHALSLTCRFNGHCRRFYSVAEHCLLMLRMMEVNAPFETPVMSPHISLAALMHDAAEAYMGDLVSPYKRVTVIGGVRWDWIEAKVMGTIAVGLGLPEIDGHDKAIVDRADLRMLATERRDLLVPTGIEWDVLRDVQPYPQPIDPHRFIDPAAVAALFRNTFAVLMDSVRAADAA